MTDIILGVDAGGSKTVAAAYTSTGEKLLQLQGEAGNITASPHTGCHAIVSTVTQLLAALQNTYPDAATPYLAVGAAGATAGGTLLQKTLHEQLGTRIHHVQVVSDAQLALYAAHGAKDGILMVSGTGSIAYRRIGKDILRCGGWGHLLGDHGSGYDIVMQAIRRITHAMDTNTEIPLRLQDALLRALGLQAFTQLISFIYNSTKAEIAALFPVVVACAKEDAIALDILHQAGEMLAQMVQTLIERHPTQEPVSIACSGSVLTKCHCVRDAFAHTLMANHLPIADIFDVSDPPSGAITMYKQQLKG